MPMPMPLGGSTNEMYSQNDLQRAVCLLELAKSSILTHAVFGGPPGVVDDRMARKVSEDLKDIFTAKAALSEAFAKVSTAEGVLRVWLDEYSLSQGK